MSCDYLRPVPRLRSRCLVVARPHHQFDVVSQLAGPAFGVTAGDDRTHRRSPGVYRGPRSSVAHSVEDVQAGRCCVAMAHGEARPVALVDQPLLRQAKFWVAPGGQLPGARTAGM